MIDVRIIMLRNGLGKTRWRVEDVSDDYPRDPRHGYSQEFRSEARAVRAQRTRTAALSRHAAKMFWPLSP